MTDRENTADAPECGRLLKRMRDRLGLSVDDVASELRLSPFQIRALEEDAWDRLPGDTYARGYLRSYARLLDLDAEQLLEGATTEELQIPPEAPSAKQEPGEAPQPDEAPAEHRPRRTAPWALLTVLVLVAGLGAYLWQTGDYSRLVPDMSATQTVEEAATQNAQPEEIVTASAEEAETGETADGHDTATQSEQTPAAPEESVAGASTNEDAPLPAGWRRIVFQFTERSWVDLRDARGERLLYRSFQPGRRIEAEGRPPFRVFLGNAGGVTIEYEDRTIEPEAIPGRIHTRLTVGEPVD